MMCAYVRTPTSDPELLHEGEQVREVYEHAEFSFKCVISFFKRLAAVLLLTCAVSVLAHVLKRALVKTSPVKPSWWEGGPLCDSPLLRDLHDRSWPTADKKPAPRISKVIYINLDSDPKRRHWMRRQLNQLNWAGEHPSIERFTAVDAQMANTSSLFQKQRGNGFNPTKHPAVPYGSWSTAGCMFSHYSLVKQLAVNAANLSKQNEVWLFLEDDTKLISNVGQGWLDLWPFVPEQWDVLRLVGWNLRPLFPNCQINARLHLAMFSDPPPSGPCIDCGAQAYVVNPSSASRVVDRFEKSKIYLTDCLLGAGTPPQEDQDRIPPLLSFAIHPMFGLQEDHLFSTDRID